MVSAWVLIKKKVVHAVFKMWLPVFMVVQLKLKMVQNNLQDTFLFLNHYFRQIKWKELDLLKEN